MTAMAKQVEDFLNTSAPFDVLDKEQKLELVKHTELIYLTADNVGDLQKGKSSLFLIQNGQFTVLKHLLLPRYLNCQQFEIFLMGCAIMPFKTMLFPIVIPCGFIKGLRMLLISLPCRWT